jgi:hypothetical protein
LPPPVVSYITYADVSKGEGSNVASFVEGEC